MEHFQRKFAIPWCENGLQGVDPSAIEDWSLMFQPEFGLKNQQLQLRTLRKQVVNFNFSQLLSACAIWEIHYLKRGLSQTSNLPSAPQIPASQQRFSNQWESVRLSSSKSGESSIPWNDPHFCHEKIPWKNLASSHDLPVPPILSTRGDWGETLEDQRWFEDGSDASDRGVGCSRAMMKNDELWPMAVAKDTDHERFSLWRLKYIIYIYIHIRWEEWWLSRERTFQHVKWESEDADRSKHIFFRYDVGNKHIP